MTLGTKISCLYPVFWVCWHHWIKGKDFLEQLISALCKTHESQENEFGRVCKSLLGREPELKVWRGWGAVGQVDVFTDMPRD